ncbi:MAG TPA: TetR/AcrR family transcriptional regulator [Nevskiaceae bacterium]|nr:TetR/AcrR family transcriptional regulator [Nevskiaceae bacterium]
MIVKMMPTALEANEHHRAAPGVDIEHLLEVSADRFAELGFDGMSMREISRECGFPAASIYHHFASKSELYREAYSHKVEQTIDLMNTRLDGVGDAKRRFVAMVEAFHELFTGDRTLLLLMQRDVIDASVARRQFLSRHQYDHFTSLIRRTASEMTGAVVSWETAFTIGSLIFGYCELSMVVHEIYDRRGPEVLHAERERLVRATLALLGASS